MNTYHSGRLQSARSGNALVIALGFSVLVIGLITAASTSSTAVLQDNLRRTAGLKARAAVEAVLQRYESRIIAKAQTGELLTWTGDAGQDPNFGQDFFGECRVRWKIEPCRTVRAQDVGGTAGGIDYMTNPSPSTTTLPNIADGEVANDYIYLYQVAAEARLGDPAQPAAVAQGVRYVSINEQPLFRYVIFYAQRGAKGDIEFSHGPQLSINGSVHSNGAIYLGSSTQVNNWGAVDPPNGDTVFGPNATGGKVLLEGLDGIFRLNKPLMFSGIDNQLNAGSGGVAVISGTRRGVTPVASSYNLVTPSFMNETTLSPPVLPDLTSLDSATKQGRVVNPYRIKDGTGFITGAAAGIDTKRKINGLEIYADWNAVTGNDSRDTGRTSKFSITSIQAPPSGWGGYVRTGLTNCQNIKIPKEITGGISIDGSLRPLEAQLINAKDPDVDPTTDNHEAAKPVFVSAGGKTEIIPVSGDILESPGLFLTYALLGGTGDVAMKRAANGRGWSVTTTSGAPLPDPPKSGLVIRERPIPETAIWPGAAAGVTIVDPSSKDYMPYAYGKHWRPSLWPFTSIDITDRLNSGWDPLNGSTGINMATANRSESYSAGGRVHIRTAQDPGLNYPNGRLDTLNTPVNNPNNYRRCDFFYDENWRFIALSRPVATATTGLKAYYFQDAHPYRDATGGQVNSNANGINGDSGNNENLRGTPFATRVDAQINHAGGVGSLPVGMAADNYSIRWEGFITPTTGGTYSFDVFADDQARVWLDGKQIINQPNYTGSATASSSMILQGGRAYSIIAEMREDGGGDSMVLSWTIPSGTHQIVPASAFTQSAPGVVNKATFTAVQARIDPTTLTGLNSLKVGLMIREHQGLSPLQNGRNPYVAMLMSPARGFFSQERLQASNSIRDSRPDVQSFIGIGSYNGGLGIADPVTGQIPLPPNGTVAPNNVVRTATLQVPVWPSTQTNNYTQGQDVSGPSGTWSGVSIGANTFSINLGDGSPSQNVNFGPVTTRSYKSPRSYNRYDSTAPSVTWVRNPPTTPPFVAGEPITLYNSGSGGSATAGTLNNTGMIGGNPTTTGTSTTNWQINNGVTSGNVDVTYGVNNASAVTIWNSGVKRADGSTMTNAELVAWLASNYSGFGSATFQNGISPKSATSGTTPTGGYSWNAAAVGATSNIGSLPAAVISTVYPPYPAITPVTITYPTFGAMSYTFSTDRTKTKDIAFDVNPYISSAGVWFDQKSAAWTPGPAAPNANHPTNVGDYLPWNNAWNASIGQAASAQVLPPVTGAFRPDVWSLAAPPGPVNPLVAPVPPVVAAQTSITGAAPGMGVIPGTRWSDDRPLVWGAVPPEVWVRIEKFIDTSVVPNRTYLRTRYYAGAVPPLNAGAFTDLTNADTSMNLVSIENFSNDLEIGLCAQSGDINVPVDVMFSNVQIETTLPAPNNVIDSTDWENGGGVNNAMGRYLASQYQAFWGGREITEDFFNYVNPATDQPMASEDWIYNPREFWSQNRLWDNGTTAKDSGTNGDGSTIISNRLLWAKTTMLTLDLGVIQGYLKTRLLSEAVRTPFTLPGFVPSIVDDFLLSTRFTGLIYAARTNRYPWNPDSGNRNPYSPAQGIDYPNINLADNAIRLSATTMAAAGFDPSSSAHNLQPYDVSVLPYAPAFKPQDFHHGVRLKNGATMTWGYTFPQNTVTKKPAMTDSRTTIVTPNQLYLQGNLNTGTNTLYYQGAFVNNKTTPMAVMGDTVTLLSNSFQDLIYQNADLKVFPNSPFTVTGTSPLATPNGAAASNTTYNTCIVTNNQPTTRESVREGQGAPVIDTLMYLENWGSQTMNYKGSLVVMDSRRYTRAFLLDVPKGHGRTMMGTLGWNAAIPDWGGVAPMPYSAPARVMLFNDDLLTEEGTPPFAPFGVTASGIGGWVKSVR